MAWTKPAWSSADPAPAISATRCLADRMKAAAAHGRPRCRCWAVQSLVIVLSRGRWYTTKTHPSYQDLLGKLRRVLIASFDVAVDAVERTRWSHTCSWTDLPLTETVAPARPAGGVRNGSQTLAADRRWCPVWALRRSAWRWRPPTPGKTGSHGPCELRPGHRAGTAHQSRRAHRRAPLNTGQQPR